MFAYILRRIMYMLAMLVVVTIVVFVIIQLPPGDFLTSMMGAMAAAGDVMSLERMETYRIRFGLDQPFHIQYIRWVSGMLRGDWGWSFEWRRPVRELIWGRMALTVAVAGASMLFAWAIAFPLGIYSAVKQYSPGDYIATFFGFIGLATPNFMLALILMWIGFNYFGLSVGGLFSPEYMEAPWGWGKFVNLLEHIWVPMVVIGTAGMAGLMRIMRANLLDELNKPYVVTARAKGMTELRLILRYPLRLALSPFLSTVGWMLPVLVSGEAIVAVVLNLPTTGPLLLRALMAQDTFLAGSFLVLLSALTLVGTLLSDIALAYNDPRIRYQ